jgi:hypothetical protein
MNVATRTLYVVTLTSRNRLTDDSQLWLYALSIHHGSDQEPPFNLNNATYTPPNGLGTAFIAKAPHKQRCGLALDGAMASIPSSWRAAHSK